MGQGNTEVISEIAPKNAADIALFRSDFFIGGVQVVLTYLALLAFPIRNRLADKTAVLVLQGSDAEKGIYVLLGGIENSNWVKASVGQAPANDSIFPVVRSLTKGTNIVTLAAPSWAGDWQFMGKPFCYNASGDEIGFGIKSRSLEEFEINVVEDCYMEASIYFRRV